MAATEHATITSTYVQLPSGFHRLHAPRLDASGAVVKDAAGNTVYTCTNPNVMDFSLAAFDAATQKVVLDIGKLFSTTDVTQ